MSTSINKEELKKSLKSQYGFTSSFISGASLMAVDCVMFMLSLCCGFFIVNAANPSCINFKSFIKYSVFLPGVLLFFYANGLYPGILLAPEEEVRRFSVSSFFVLVGEAFFIITIKSLRDFFPIAIALAISWPFATILLPLGREISRRFFGKFFWWGVPAVIYSKSDTANFIVERLLSRKHLGYKPLLIITDSFFHEKEFRGIPVVENTDEINEIIRELRIKCAIVCNYNKKMEEIQKMYRYIIYVPKNQITVATSLHMKDFGGILAFSTTNFLTKKSSMFLKRFLDIFVCLCALPVLIPVTIAVIIAIKRTDKGPVLYGHVRVGKNHKQIKCWKFRSMCTDADQKLKEILENDPVRAAEWEKDRKFTDDPRVTKVGKFLRKTSLDEIPQLWNIFLGEMSLVGPRPVTEPELTKYGNYADYVLSVKPGLSGMWQISGRSDTGYEERINLDTYYIQNWSIWLDIWILIKTVGVVLKGKGAY